jgi:hypothetical protein
LRLRVPIALAIALTLLRPAAAAAVPEIKLPFAGGTRVAVVQGYNAITHTGVEQYSLDLVVLDGETAGAQVLSPAAGTVVWADPPGVPPGCFAFLVEDGDGLHVMVCHLILDRPLVTGERLARGQRVGRTGAPGQVANNGQPHIHLQLYRAASPARRPVPFAAPEGAPLDGNSLPADGSRDQWACLTYPRCPALVSTNAASAPPATPRASPPAAVGAIPQSMAVRGTDSCLRVRESPSVDGRVLRCLPDGTLVTVVDGPRDAEGRSWLRLEGGGWVDADFLKPASAPAPPAVAPTAAPAPAATADATVASGETCLNVRRAPGLAASIVACLADGTRVTLTGERREADGRTWLEIAGQGWAAAEYLQ